MSTDRMKSNLRILAVDPAAACGFAHSNGQIGTWKLAGTGDDGRRIDELLTKLHAAHRDWGVDLLAFEDASFGSRNPHVQAMHNELRGALKLFAFRIGAKTVHYAPTSIKAFATGSGRAKKPQMMAAFRTHFKCDAIDDNAADAKFILCMAEQGYQPMAKPKSKPRGKRASKSRESLPRSLFG